MEATLHWYIQITSRLAFQEIYYHYEKFETAVVEKKTSRFDKLEAES